MPFDDQTILVSEEETRRPHLLGWFNLVVWLLVVDKSCKGNLRGRCFVEPIDNRRWSVAMLLNVGFWMCPLDDFCQLYSQVRLVSLQAILQIVRQIYAVPRDRNVLKFSGLEAEHGPFSAASTPFALAFGSFVSACRNAIRKSFDLSLCMRTLRIQFLCLIEWFESGWKEMSYSKIEYNKMKWYFLERRPLASFWVSFNSRHFLSVFTHRLIVGGVATSAVCIANHNKFPRDGSGFVFQLVGLESFSGPIPIARRVQSYDPKTRLDLGTLVLLRR